MTKKELSEAPYKGVLATVGEYRASEAKAMSGVKEGRSWAFKRVIHTVEVANKTQFFEEELEEKADVAKYVSPWKKGQEVVMVYDRLKIEKGVTKSGGKLEPLAP